MWPTVVFDISKTENSTHPTIPSFPMQLWRHAGCFFVSDILLFGPSIKSKMLFLANHNAKIKKKKNYNKLRKIPEYFFSKACGGRFSKILFEKIKSRDCQRFSFTFTTYMLSKATFFRKKKPYIQTKFIKNSSGTHSIWVAAISLPKKLFWTPCTTTANIPQGILIFKGAACLTLCYLGRSCNDHFSNVASSSNLVTHY